MFDRTQLTLNKQPPPLLYKNIWWGGGDKWKGEGQDS